MDALRKLAICYLVASVAFASAAGLRAWPQTAAMRERAGALFSVTVWHPAEAALARAARLLDPPMSEPRVVLALAPPPQADGTGGRTGLVQAPAPLPPRPPRFVQPGEVLLTLDAPVTIAPDLPPPPEPVRAAAAPQATSSPAPKGAKLTAEEARARARLAATLTPEMRDHFGLFIFVSKAVRGPLAQRMYVFRKQGGALDLLYDWAASTGREKNEKDAQGDPAFTATPAGLYQLDPERMYRQYRSVNWAQDMPYAMFFNWQREGLQTGLAIHAAGGDDIDQLGRRASAGCVHLSPQNARTLFNLVRSQYRGEVPRFAIDASDTMSRNGRFSRRADGSLRMTDGYRVLIDIENYAGNDDDAVALF